MYQSSRQFVRKDRWDTGGVSGSLGIFRGILFRHLRCLRLQTRARTARADCRPDVRDHSMVAVRASFCASCLLSLLFVFGGVYISAGGAGGRRLAGTLGREHGIGAEESGKTAVQFVRRESSETLLLGWNRRGEVEPSVILRAAEITFT